MTLTFSCKSGKQKETERLNKESTEIFSTALADAKTKGFPLNYDSLMNAFAQKSLDSPAVALEYAKRFKEAISNVEYSKPQEPSGDTTKYFELKLVKKEVFVNSAKLDFQLKNLLDKPIEDFGLKASLWDKNGEYLADELTLTWENIRPGGIRIASTWWADIKLSDVGGVVLIPYELTINRQDYKFDGGNIRILENKLGIKLSF